MKKCLFAFLLLGLIACGNKKTPASEKPATDSVTTKAPGEDKSYLKKRPEQFPDFFKLSTVQPFKGKVATKKDMEEGKAVFVMDSDDPSHKTCNIHLPFFAFRKMKEGKPVFVAVLQAEMLKGDTLLGYRQGNGQYGMCHPNELEYFENEKGFIFSPEAPAAQ